MTCPLNPARTRLVRKANLKLGKPPSGWSWRFRAEGESRDAKGRVEGTLYAVRAGRGDETKRTVTGYIVA